MNDHIAQYGGSTQVGYTNTSYASPSVPARDTISTMFTQISIVSATLSALFIAITFYAMLRMFMIQKHEKDHVDHAIHEHQARVADAARNPRWELIENLIASASEIDWRVAIIEADVLLEEALEYGGFTGQGIGEMLTSAGERPFSTYKYAWEAHRVRNDIAHEGSNYKLSKVDAVKTIHMYKIVLEEFGVV